MAFVLLAYLNPLALSLSNPAHFTLSERQTKPPRLRRHLLPRRLDINRMLARFHPRHPPFSPRLVRPHDRPNFRSRPATSQPHQSGLSTFRHRPRYRHVSSRQKQQCRRQPRKRRVHHSERQRNPEDYKYPGFWGWRGEEGICDGDGLPSLILRCLKFMGVRMYVWMGVCWVLIGKSGGVQGKKGKWNICLQM